MLDKFKSLFEKKPPPMAAFISSLPVAELRQRSDAALAARAADEAEHPAEMLKAMHVMPDPPLARLRSGGADHPSLIVPHLPEDWWSISPAELPTRHQALFPDMPLKQLNPRKFMASDGRSARGLVYYFDGADRLECIEYSLRILTADLPLIITELSRRHGPPQIASLDRNPMSTGYHPESLKQIAPYLDRLLYWQASTLERHLKIHQGQQGNWSLLAWVYLRGEGADLGGQR